MQGRQGCFFEYEYEYRPPGRTEYEYDGCGCFAGGGQTGECLASREAAKPRSWRGAVFECGFPVVARAIFRAFARARNQSMQFRVFA